jgi:hypothetical protein
MIEPLQPFDVIPEPVALGLAVLLLDPQQWINRRVERVAYLDRVTVRRHISVDFDVPPADKLPGRTVDNQRFLPIAQFAKDKLVNFDLRDHEDLSIPMLTAEQNGRVSSALLLAFARLHGEHKLDPIVDRYIPRLVTARSEAERELAWNRIFQRGTSVGEHLLRRPAFVAIADNLRRNFILYLPVSEPDAGTRKIIKLGFDAP